MYKHTFTCDQCEKDLTDSGPMPAYRIAVECQNIPSTSSFSYCIAVLPEWAKTLHFCGKQCLVAFMTK